MGANTDPQPGGDWETCRRRGWKIVGVRAYWSTRPIESTNNQPIESHGLTETKVATTEPGRVCTRPSAHMLWLFDLGVFGIHKSGSGGISDSYTCLVNRFIPTFLSPAMIWGCVFSHIVSYYDALRYHVMIFLGSKLISRGIQRSASGGEEGK